MATLSRQWGSAVVGEALGSGRPRPEGSVGTAAAPYGFSVRYSPADLAGQWHDVVNLDDGRVGVLIGCCTDPEAAHEMRSAARSALLATGDPVRSLDCVTGNSASAVCAVIDDETIGYIGHGDANTAIATPDTQGPAVQHANGRLVVAPLAPGATVLLCTGEIGQAAAVLDGCEAIHPDQVADLVIDRLGGSDIATVLYRHPPAPLSVTLAAHPAGLAVSRGRLRRWLAAAGVDAESSADILLAVGEATANATEHAVVGTNREVAITVTATITGSRLLLTVSDNGVWKPAPVSPGHRGHGIPLINALVDSADLTTTPEGTTVAMVKELRP